MEIQTEITRKEISFIDDIDFRNILYDRLGEIDRVFIVNANYSTVFLSISTIEGIFKHLSSIYKSEIKQLSTYPKIQNGKPKQFDKITIDELYILLKQIDILPEIKDFEKVYRLFKDYRNFIHPQAQHRKSWTVDLGQAQMALGLLNATLEHLSHNIFISKEIYQKVAGNPDYDKNKVLHLNLDRTRVHSFVVTKRHISNKLSLSFGIEFQGKSVFNFVFNYKNENSFKMLRLDNRLEQNTPNCLLHCTQRYFWRVEYISEEAIPPQKPIIPIQIEIDFSNRLFKFIVDGKQYSFKKNSGGNIDLFSELTPDLQIGFFNEVGPVKLHNIKLN